MNKLVSIVLPTYNGEQYIRESIDSVISQTYKNWELIVVDDCSKDNTSKIVEEYVNKDKRIRLIKNDINQKLPASLNIGFSNANGEYYTWTSDDNKYKPDAIQTMVNTLEKDNSCILVSANMDYIDSFGNITGSLQDTYEQRNIYQLVDSNNVMACFLYRADAAKEVGGYDTSTFGAEDYDYWFRIALKGKICYIEDNLYQYRYHNKSLTATYFDKALERAWNVKFKYFYPVLRSLGYTELEIINTAISKYKKTNKKEYLSIAKRNNIILYYLSRFKEKLFAIDNQNLHKVITLCGIKFKIKSKTLFLKHLLNEIKEYRYWSVNKSEDFLEQINKNNDQLKNLNESFINLKAQIKDIYNNLTILSVQFNYLSNIQSIIALHQKVFPKYRNINQGKDVVIVATGASLNNFQPISGAVYVGINNAFKYNKVKFDYLFLQDYSGTTPTYIEDFCNYDAKKFLGFIPDYIPNTMQCIIPEKFSNYPNVERYYVAHPTQKDNFTFDISTQPLGDAYSIVFPAMQFILWTNPRRIYIVGSDCNTNGYYSSSEKNNLAVDEVIEGWKNIKKFAHTYYPDTEIISVNPVGLKGLFKDLNQIED